MKNSTMSQQANGLIATEGMPMADLAAIESASADVIRSRILTVRGVQVMLDRDLAALYGVPTKALNQAVKRNIERFPEEFMFAVSGEEMYELVTNCDRFRNMKHSSVPMRAFTERGTSFANDCEYPDAWQCGADGAAEGCVSIVAKGCACGGDAVL